ncbi:hypothetical protein [Sorangium sp. So ce394]|uniref:hypothetical protein n=1 Tax=Sorangium sp. So ce394 TaxID=3133310 RepID=UPI003F5C4AAF
MRKSSKCRPSLSSIHSDLRTYPCLIRGCHCDRRVRIRTLEDGRRVAFHVRE